MPKTTILITGANGQLGNEFRSLEASYPDHSFVFLTRNELSITDAASVNDVFKKHHPQWCINCAAYTAVDKAETEQDLAMAINAEATGILAQASATAGSRFVHISTDYVFDGSSSKPYTEDSPTGPINIYGHSKLRGEELALECNADSVIIRTSWVYSQFGNNFVKTMLRLMRERESINVVADQTGSPTYAADLANSIMQLIVDPSSDKHTGIFHYSNEGQITWHEFALAIKEMTGSKCIVNPIPTSAYPTPAKRPQYSLLDKSKIRSALKLHIPEWRTSLETCMVKMKNVK